MTGIVPDSKDWTWVLDRRCPQCGLDTRNVQPEQVAQQLRDNAAAWPAVLARPDVRQRPDPATWSPLEYACHVRDVFRLYDERLLLMLTQDDPLYPNWDQDQTALVARYAEQDLAAVATELAAAGEQLAARFAASKVTNGSAPAAAATALASPLPPSPATSSTTPSTTSTM